MNDLDTLLAQALALVSEDKRGQLADVIEEIVAETRRATLEEAAQRSCLGCLSGTPLEDDPVLGLVHRHERSRPTQCGAFAIHHMIRVDQQTKLSLLAGEPRQERLIP